MEGCEAHPSNPIHPTKHLVRKCGLSVLKGALRLPLISKHQLLYNNISAYVRMQEPTDVGHVRSKPDCLFWD